MRSKYWLTAYCPFYITWKEVFAWHFILHESILFWRTISYQKPFVFSVSVFCSQKCTLKFNLLPKITYAISIVKWFFFYFCLRKYFLLFLTEFELLMFHSNIVKISEKLNKQKLLKVLRRYFAWSVRSYFPGKVRTISSVCCMLNLPIAWSMLTLVQLNKLIGHTHF